jgi:hypothetical protein
MLLAGGALATSACGNLTTPALDTNGDATADAAGGDATTDDANADVTLGFDAPGFCCNAAPDPCCEYLYCDAAITPQCSQEMACEAEGGTWDPYPGSCSYEAGAADAGSSDAAGDSPSDGGVAGD